MKQVDNMKNGLRYEAVVGKVQNVSKGASALRNTAKALPDRAKRITSELLPLLDSVAPDHELYNLRKGAMGYGAVKDTWGHSKEAEYVRREGGMGAIAEKAGRALTKISEVEQSLDKECAGFATAYREKSANKNAGRWTKLIQGATYVVGTIAAGGAVLAGIVGMPAVGLAVTAGSIIAAAILYKGQRGMPVLAPREQADLSEAKRMLADLRLDLNELARN